MAATANAEVRRRRRPALVAAVILLLSAVGWYAGPADAVAAQTTVDLTNDTGSALFDGSRPLGTRSPQTACLTVSGTGAGSTDTVSIAAVDVSGALADHLQLTVDIGSGGGGGSCTGFTGTRVWSGTLTDLANTPGDGIDTGWYPAATPTRSFRISAIIASGSTVAGGTSASGKFAWRLVPGAVPPPPTTPPTTTAPPTTTVPPTTAPTTTSSTTRTTHTVEPTPTPTVPHTIIVVTTEAPQATPTPSPTGTPTSYPSGTLDTSIPTTPGAPTGGNRPTPTGSMSPGAVGGGGHGGSGTTGSGGGSGADVVLGAVTKVKAVPAAVGNALGSLVSSSLSPLLGGDSAEKAGQTVAAVIASPQYPLVVIILAILFLLVQYRIDARDPKLAKARVRQRDDELQFPDLFGVRAALGRLPFGARRDAVPPTGTISSLGEPTGPSADGPPHRWVPWRR